MKQTAVEWFFDNLKNHEIQAEHFELFEQAKEMEKQQIIDACIYGNGLDYYDARKIEGLKYYKKTFNK